MWEATWLRSQHWIYKHGICGCFSLLMAMDGSVLNFDERIICIWAKKSIFRVIFVAFLLSLHWCLGWVSRLHIKGGGFPPGNASGKLYQQCRPISCWVILAYCQQLECPHYVAAILCLWGWTFQFKNYFRLVARCIAHACARRSYTMSSAHIIGPKWQRCSGWHSNSRQYVILELTNSQAIHTKLLTESRHFMPYYGLFSCDLHILEDITPCSLLFVEIAPVCTTFMFHDSLCHHNESWRC